SLLVTATAATQLYTLSLHDALPIWMHRGRVARASARDTALESVRPDDDLQVLARHDQRRRPGDVRIVQEVEQFALQVRGAFRGQDRKSTRLNSSHVKISYAVFCLKK